MSLFEDSITMCRRELLIFVANLTTNVVRTAMFPLVILVFFSFLGAAITNTPVAVVNYASNQQSTQFITALGSRSLINVEPYPSQSEAIQRARSGQG